MPTARELLDQADALMRRNRAPSDDIPTLTDEVPAGLGRGAQGAPSKRPGLPAADRDSEAIPVLTDAVEEIEAPALDDMPFDDEPSIWPETLRGARSITDQPAETTAVVPSHTAPTGGAAHIASPATTPTQLSPSPAVSPPRTLTAGGVATSGAAMPGAIASASTDSGTDEEKPASPSIAVTLDLDMPRPEPERSLAALPPLDLGTGQAIAPSPSMTVTRDEVGAPTTPDPASWRTMAAETLANFRSTEEHSSPSPPESAGVPEPTNAAPTEARAATTADDEARWAALAEEIRMQVLQRIDLFTDAGLREQLGERLKPIVDRASADLVATINTHVGELLRAYVAEAIEREIERWRDAH